MRKRPSTALVDPMASVRFYLASEKSDNTRRAYKSDWTDFTSWCEKRDERPLPADPLVVAQYLAHLADRGIKVSTITRRATAIRYLHKAAGHEPPTNAEGVRAVLRGIRRRKGSSPNRKAPATAAAIARMLEALPNTFARKRDRALLLVAFAAALRRSELVALNVDDVDIGTHGMLITLRRSKTDQEGQGRTIAVPAGKKLKPVAVLRAWLKAAKITSGPIFRDIDRYGNIGKHALSGRSVARIVKKAAAAAGLDPMIFAGHSMRAGFVTSALNDGVDPLKVMGVTGHKKVDTLKIYDRRERGFKEYAGKGFL